MADFESIVKNHVGEDGNIPSEAIAKLVKAISTAVGNEFVEKSRYKAKLEEIDALTEEKQTAQDSATTAEKWKTKYEAIKNDFDEFKGQVTAKEAKTAKESAVRAYYESKGITGKALDIAMRGSAQEIDAIEMDGDKIKDSSALDNLVSGVFSGLVSHVEVQGANTSNPPTNSGGVGMTKAEIYKKDDHGHYVLSAAERQKALMENQIL